MNISYPKISYVTPVFNQVEFIEQTILSVIDQDYPNFEYIIVDGGSTDGTLEIIKKYESRIFKWISEPDTGMYNALNKGFRLTSGEIMGWINGDDILLPEAFSYMHKLFRDLPEVNWIQGLNSFIDVKGDLTHSQVPKKFSLVKFLNKDFKWIQQESTFWRRSLWEKAGGKMDDNLKLAGDFELWFRFFQNTKLYNTNIPIGAWRKREGQLSEKFMTEYLREAYSIIEIYKSSKYFNLRIQLIKLIDKLNSILVRRKYLNFKFLENKKNRLYGIDDIEILYSKQENKFIIYKTHW